MSGPPSTSSLHRLSGSDSADGRVPSPLPPFTTAPTPSSSSSSSPPAILSSWSPKPAELQLVFTLLSDPLPGSAGSQSHYAQLNELKGYPEFSNYLSYILACCKDEQPTTRAKAGLQLKNTVKEQWERMSAPQQEYIKAAVIESMAAERGLHHVVGTIIANIAVRCRIVGWPGILQHLMASLDSPDANVQLVAFNALSKICEDAGKELIKDDAALGKPLHFLIPKLISFFHHPKAELRVYALTAVNVFLYLMPLVMRMHLDSFLQAVFVLAKSDDVKEVRKRVCAAFVVLLENKNGHDKPLQPHMDGVINFMLHACNDSDENVALEASEFWSAYCDSKADTNNSQPNGDIQLLAKYLQPLTATLLKGMRYCEEDIVSDDEDDANVPDRQQDIRPNIHRGKTVNYEGAAAGGGGGGGAAAASHDSSAAAAGGNSAADSWGEEYEDEETDDDDDDFFDEEDDEEVQNWNLRKCSASALDSLANTYGSLLFAHLLPLLKELLASNPSAAASSTFANQPATEQWILRESAILALGAVAEGSFDAIMPHLPELVPYLLSFLTDKKPLVRSITCWTLSRYSKWVVTEPQQTFFQPLLEGLLASILDSNKKVQEAACSAFATFEEEAGVRLSAHLPRILQFLMHAFGKYQQKNMLILYDAIGTLAESVGDMLNQPQCVNLLMPPLMQRWQQLNDDDRSIFPLFECLGSVATSLGDGFLPFAQPVYQRCLAIIQRTLEQQQAVEQHNQQAQSTGTATDYEYVDLEFIVCALDLLSGVTEGLGQLIEPLIPHSPIMQLLYQCFTQYDTRILTADGFLFYDQIKGRMDSLQPVMFACYDVASGGLVYRTGKLVEPDTPSYLVDFHSSDETDSTTECGDKQLLGSHFSLRVTPDHRMYVQTGSTDDTGEFVPMNVNPQSKQLFTSPSMMSASDLLTCDCPTSFDCSHRTTHIRFTSHAAAGHSPALPFPYPTHIQQQLRLSDDQLLVFAELLGYWLLNGSIDRLKRAVCFDQLCASDSVWLRDMLAAVGLSSSHCQFSLSECADSCIAAAVECCLVTSPPWFAYFDGEFSTTPMGSADCNQLTAPLLHSSGTASKESDEDDYGLRTLSPTSSGAASSSGDNILPGGTDESNTDDGDDVRRFGQLHIPQWVVMSLSATQLNSFIRGLQRASSSSPDCVIPADLIYTSDATFRDQLLQLLLHAGHTAVARCVHSNQTDGGQYWALEWTSAANTDGTVNTAGRSSYMPLVKRTAGGVTRVPYSAERDGRVWCVTVDHPDHLIVAQRAEQHNGTVTELWRPVIVGQCMSDRDPDVRQSAFALLGDLSKAACSHLLPFLGYFLPRCAMNLNPHYSSVCNNASWAVGELAIKAGREPLLPHVEPLMQYLILILCPPPQPNGGSSVQQQYTAHSQSQRVSASLLENASITIGRLGLVCPQPVAVRLAEYASVWFSQLERLRDNAEKEHAYHGMCSVVESNPTAVLSDLPALLSVVCGWRQMNNERMVVRLRSLLHNFKVAFDGQGERGVQQWSAAINAVSDDKRRLLNSAFGV